MWSTIYLSILGFLFLLYATAILMYRYWFVKLKQYKVPEKFVPSTSFSIIIPARNESSNIVSCLQTIFNNEYPIELYEIIVVDDHSTDNTSALVLELQKTYSNLKLLRLADEIDGQLLNAYKKKAIEKAINLASKDWIITTDADCFMQKEWLRNFAAYIQETGHVLVAAPVVFLKENNVLSMFQYIDFLSLQGITAASVSAGFHTMCNGANLAYQKAAFNAVGGFRDIDHIASGDDMLLMNKIKKQYPDGLGYLYAQQATVATHPMPSWKAFLNQRVRWASKADQLKDKSVLLVLVLVYFFNLLIFLMPLMALFNVHYLLYCLIALLLKTVIELSFSIPVGRFFGQSFVWWFPLLQPIHITYTVVAGWLGKFGSYQWKGRNVK